MRFLIIRQLLICYFVFEFMISAVKRPETLRLRLNLWLKERLWVTGHSMSLGHLAFFLWRITGVSIMKPMLVKFRIERT